MQLADGYQLQETNNVIWAGHKNIQEHTETNSEVQRWDNMTNYWVTNERM